MRSGRVRARGAGRADAGDVKLPTGIEMNGYPHDRKEREEEG